MKPSRRGTTVEKIAEIVLEEQGFKIKERHKRVKIKDVDVAEIDLIAEKNGNLYAIEVKAGRVSVTDLRQAYTNAKLINAKPLIVCRGYSDRAAEETAKELGIKVLELPEYFVFVEPEELMDLVEKALAKILLSLMVVDIEKLSEEDLEVLNAIAYSSHVAEAANRLGVNKRKMRTLLQQLRKKGFVSEPKNYDLLRLQALLALKEYSFRKLLENLRSAKQKTPTP